VVFLFYMPVQVAHDLIKFFDEETS
jgi:hypothetical protein